MSDNALASNVKSGLESLDDLLRSIVKKDQISVNQQRPAGSLETIRDGSLSVLDEIVELVKPTSLRTQPAQETESETSRSCTCARKRRRGAEMEAHTVENERSGHLHYILFRRIVKFEMYTNKRVPKTKGYTITIISDNWFHSPTYSHAVLVT